jgi:hypothetical protein
MNAVRSRGDRAARPRPPLNSIRRDVQHRLRPTAAMTIAEELDRASLPLLASGFSIQR